MLEPGTILRMMYLNARQNCRNEAHTCQIEEEQGHIANYRKYILADIKRETIREIADALGLPEVYDETTHQTV